MYICVYVYMHMYIYIYAYVYMYVFNAYLNIIFMLFLLTTIFDKDYS